MSRGSLSENRISLFCLNIIHSKFPFHLIGGGGGYFHTKPAFDQGIAHHCKTPPHPLPCLCSTHRLQ